MSWQADIVGKERYWAESLAPHVEGPVLLAAFVSIGGMTRIAWFRRTLYGGERGLPPGGLIAVTPTDIYLFEGGVLGGPGPELCRWPRATLTAKVKPFGPTVRLFLKLESGKKAIIVFLGRWSSSAVRDRVRQLFGGQTEEHPAPASVASPSHPAVVSQSEAFSGLRETMLAGTYPVLDSGETIRAEFGEMAPAPLILGPLLVFYGFFLPLFRLAHGRKLLLTDSNLYLVRGHGADTSVLHKKPLGSVRIKCCGSIARGRYLEIDDQKFWTLGPPEELEKQIMAAAGREPVGE